MAKRDKRKPVCPRCHCDSIVIYTKGKTEFVKCTKGKCSFSKPASAFWNAPTTA